MAKNIACQRTHNSRSARYCCWKRSITCNTASPVVVSSLKTWIESSRATISLLPAAPSACSGKPWVLISNRISYAISSPCKAGAPTLLVPHFITNCLLLKQDCYLHCRGNAVVRMSKETPRPQMVVGAFLCSSLLQKAANFNTNKLQCWYSSLYWHRARQPDPLVRSHNRGYRCPRTTRRHRYRSGGTECQDRSPYATRNRGC